MTRTFLLIMIGLLAYAATGVYFVPPDQQAVVRRFGRLQTPLSQPGAHFGLPWGLDRVDLIRPQEVKRVSIGTVEAAGQAVGTNDAQFLTADRNLVNVRATVQYTIKDPPQFLFAATSVDPMIAQAGQAALSHVLAAESVDHALTLGKRDLAIRVADALQQAADRYGLGVTIRSVDIGGVAPPPEVAPAFDNVIAALRQREQQINQAHSTASRTLAQGQSDAQRLRDQARADADRAVRQAEGDAARFDKLLAEYRQSPSLTARRLYLETMAEVLPKFRSKLIIDSGTDLDLSILREEKR